MNREIVEVKYTLKPCPFCNSIDVKRIKTSYEPVSTYQVHCSKCGARGPVQFGYKDAVGFFWNKRETGNFKFNMKGIVMYDGIEGLECSKLSFWGKLKHSIKKWFYRG